MDRKKALREDATQEGERTSVRMRDGRSVPVDGVPVDEVPMDEVPVDEVPVDGVPVDGSPTDEGASQEATASDEAVVTREASELYDAGVAAVRELGSGERSDGKTSEVPSTSQTPEVHRPSSVRSVRSPHAVRVAGHGADVGFLDSIRAPEGSFFRSEEERATTLVLMESGAFWPGWVKEVQRRAPNSIVEVQSAAESVEGFGGRVLRRLLSLRDRGVKLRAAVYAAASPATEQERGVRRLLCSTLLDVLGDTGELVLSGEGWSTWGVDARSRAELMALAGDLSHQLPRGSTPPTARSVGAADVSAGAQRSSAPSRVTVSVRFGDAPDAPDQSGVHKAARHIARDVRRSEPRAGGDRFGDDDAAEEDELTREIA